jgi:plasmid maintenance system antidote protein VapI
VSRNTTEATITNISFLHYTGKFFGNTPQFWLGLQNDYDIEEERTGINAELMKIKQLQVV